MASNILPKQSVNNNKQKHFEIGDLVWAKIGQYPFWPSIVCNDPSSKTYLKNTKWKNKLMFHVRFCYDNGRRNWAKSIEPYCSKNELCLKYPYCLKYLKNKENLTDTWNLAVEEANNLLKVNRGVRMEAFFKEITIVNGSKKNISALNNSPKKSITTNQVHTNSRKRSRKTSAHNVIDSKIIKTHNVSLNSARTFSKYNSEQCISNDHSKPTVRSKTSTSTQTSSKDENLKISNLTKINNKKDRQPNKESGKSNFSAIIANNKDQNMFIKTNERACVVCKKFENTFKCAGACQSFFHKECMAKSDERVSQTIKNSSKENFDIPSQKNKICVSKSVNSLKSSSNGECLDHENSESDNLLKNKNVVLTEKYVCSSCAENKIHCSQCNLYIKESEQKAVCKITKCKKYYHEKCLNNWPHTKWIDGPKNNMRLAICPQHVCHLCVSNNPNESCLSNFPHSKLIRCIKCPTAYHRNEYCFPAGCQILTYSDIICANHLPDNKQNNYKSNWCFVCSSGSGLLVCCDFCPITVHLTCVKLPPESYKDGYTCDECYTGRFPLYGEVVWIKLGVFRWWPAKILFPNQVPDKLNEIHHSVGEFAVQFYGSYDTYWVNRGQAYLYMSEDGIKDTKLPKSKKKKIDIQYDIACLEASEECKAYISKKEKHDAFVTKMRQSKPPSYRPIKFNKYYSFVKNKKPYSHTACSCDSSLPNPCGPRSNCLNRNLMIECHPKICPARMKCNNLCFQQANYPAMKTFFTDSKGWGLMSLEDIKKGSFIIEYVGDVINQEEFNRRSSEMIIRKEQHYYFFTISNSLMIDAGPNGNLSRFMNHSCDPNCESQKWTVNGETRIGIFALNDIPSGTELVFDYQFQTWDGVDKQTCLCQTAKCSKIIGVKLVEEKKKVKPINNSKKCKKSSKNLLKT